MIIDQRVIAIASSDILNFAWIGLRRYSSAKQVSDRIIQRHSLPRSQLRNAEKQAKQIGFCLSQAREYFDAASNASLATKPVQLYYGCMALALAEILWKGDGNISLDRIRGSHDRHGLLLKQGNLSLIFGADASAEIGAKIDARDGIGRGTFALWRKYARNAPLIGDQQIKQKDGSSQSGLAVIFAPDDIEGPAFPAEGITLLECARNIPALYQMLPSFNVASHLVRSTFRQNVTFRDDGADLTILVSIHPYLQDAIEKVADDFLFRAFMFEKLHVRASLSGFVATINIDSVHVPRVLHIPEGVSVSATETFLRPKHSFLSEFGYYYVALYICGMFSRYYPDIWMKHLECNSELSLIVEQICNEAMRRLPLLLLGELDQTAYVQK